jgi:hypothetical protein
MHEPREPEQVRQPERVRPQRRAATEARDRLAAYSILENDS